MKGIRNFFGSIVRWARTHKVPASFAGIVLFFGAYYAYGALFVSSAETRYVLANVGRGTVIASVSAGGQVSASNQLEIQPKASGEIISVNVSPGQKVSAGAVIAVIDSTSAQKAVRDAQANLESAKISYQKLVQPADALSLLQAQNALIDAQSALVKAYDDSFTDISSTFLDLPTIVTAADEIIMDDTLNPRNQANNGYYRDFVRADDSANYLKTTTFVDRAVSDYRAARTAYDATILLYKNTLRTASPDEILALLDQTNDATKAVAQALLSEQNLLDFLSDYGSTHSKPLPALALTYKTNLRTYIGQTNGHLVDLSSIGNSIISSKQSLAERTESLSKLQGGADPLDVATQKLSLTRSENALLDAQRVLADYSVRAPFAGTIAKLNVKKYDSAGGTAIATLVTNQKMAELSLNEVDVAKIEIGDKAVLTFDAIEDLTFTGAVAEIDTIGTVVQGVVSYSIKIGFDTQDDRIKSGMSVNASIQTDVRQDVLVVPSTAVKTQNGVSVVQVFTPALTAMGGTSGVTSEVAPQQVEVTIGIFDDTSVEILSGLTEGEQIVTRTISAAAAKATAATTATTNRGPGGGAGIRF